MKGHMSKKHDRHNYKHTYQDSKESNGGPLRYKNVLKERHYKEEEEKSKRKDKDRDLDPKYSSHSHKSKKSHSPQPHRHAHHKNSAEEKGRKHHVNEINESYEELSRRKRKLESELRALDMEEAAEKEAENKKARREKPKDDKMIKKYVPEIKIKNEPIEEDRKPPRTKTQTSVVKAEKDRHKTHVNKSLDEKQKAPKSEPDSKGANKEKPNFAVSGKLAEDTNTYNGVVIKYNEPAEARKPKKRWRLYPFKGDSDLPFIPIHRQSAYLFGRTRLIADIPIDHPSCSKQHAVLQYRLVSYKREDGTTGRRVRPYIIDLESSNGTFVNNKKVEPRCYVELIEKDIIKFGFSSREYVLLHEESKNDDEDEEVSEHALEIQKA